MILRFPTSIQYVNLSIGLSVNLTRSTVELRIGQSPFSASVLTIGVSRALQLSHPSAHHCPFQSRRAYHVLKVRGRRRRQSGITANLSEQREPSDGPSVSHAPSLANPRHSRDSVYTDRTSTHSILEEAESEPSAVSPNPPSFSSLYRLPANYSGSSKLRSSYPATIPRTISPVAQLLECSASVASGVSEESSTTASTAFPTKASPAFGTLRSSPEQEPSSSTVTATPTVVAETKAALPPDTKDREGSSSKDDDVEPPPPYTEGSSPLESFTYIMAAAGGAASIITQVSQGGGPPVSTLGVGSDENITLELR